MAETNAVGAVVPHVSLPHISQAVEHSLNPSGRSVRPEDLKITLSVRYVRLVNTRYSNGSYEFPNG